MMLKSMTTCTRIVLMAVALGIPSMAPMHAAETATSAPVPVIDTHIHLWDIDRPGGIAWPGAGSPLYETYVASHFAGVAGPAKVTAAVIVEASGRVEDNQWMLDLMENEPALLALVGNLDLNSEEFGKNLARFAANPRFVGIRRGVREADLDNERILTSLRDLEARGLALDIAISGGMSLAEVAAIAAALPQLTIVVNHVATRHIDGNPPDSAWVADVAALAKHPKVYMKISGLYQNTRTQPAPTDLEHYASTLDAVWRALGEDRLVFGSNWPVSTLYGEYKPIVDIVRAFLADKSQAAREKVMWKNAVQAYNLKFDGGGTSGDK